MQENQNGTIRPIFHVAEEFLNYFIFLLHMVMTAYVTFLLYLANRPEEQGTVCLVAFFIDWNILLFLTMPLLKYVKRVMEKPAGLLLLLLFAVFFSFLLISTADENIVVSIHEGILHYKPVFLLRFF